LRALAKSGSAEDRRALALAMQLAWGSEHKASVALRHADQDIGKLLPDINLITPVHEEGDIWEDWWYLSCQRQSCQAAN
jgi:hypothetical protein